MKYLPAVAGALLGLVFIALGVVVLFNLVTMPPPLPGTPMASFMDAFVPTGYMKFVKVCEILGGLLVAIPFTRNWGLLILGPILVNILAFHVFVGDGSGLKDPVLIVLCLLAAYLLWNGRAGFLGLLGRARPAPAVPLP